MSTALPYCVLADGCISGERSLPKAILSGSFNPLHHGHRLLAQVAGQKLGAEVHFELSVRNVDKPELSTEELAQRVQQFRTVAPIWVTAAPTFREKATLFPGSTFVMGFDTVIRLIDERYYHEDLGRRDAALRHIQSLGCRILVGGRVDAQGHYRVWNRAQVGEPFQELFEVLTEQDFRMDLSSTLLRTQFGE